jgi:hypothetical protein
MREVAGLLGLMLTMAGLGVITPALLAYEGAVRCGLSENGAQGVALLVGCLMIGAYIRLMWR